MSAISFGLNPLPELFVHTCSFLSLPTRVVVAQVSRKWNAMLMSTYEQEYTHIKKALNLTVPKENTLISIRIRKTTKLILKKFQSLSGDQLEKIKRKFETEICAFYYLDAFAIIDYLSHRGVEARKITNAFLQRRQLHKTVLTLIAMKSFQKAFQVAMFSRFDKAYFISRIAITVADHGQISRGLDFANRMPNTQECASLKSFTFDAIGTKLKTSQDCRDTASYAGALFDVPLKAKILSIAALAALRLERLTDAMHYARRISNRYFAIKTLTFHEVAGALLDKGFFSETISFILSISDYDLLFFSYWSWKVTTLTEGAKKLKQCGRIEEVTRFIEAVPHLR